MLQMERVYTMNQNLRNSPIAQFFVGFFLLVSVAGTVLAGPVAPKIINIEINRTNVIVTVDVSEGLRKVTLESRTRAVGSAWIPRAVNRLDGKGASTVFSLPVKAELELLRVRGDEGEPLPEHFYKGTNKFVGEKVSGDLNAVTDGPPVFNTTAVTPESKNSTTDSSRSVTESDIWKVEGSTIYYYNQYRGLQVIDIQDPESPKLTGTYELPAAGEQMYVLPSGFVVLLARDNCYSTGSDRNLVIILQVKDGKPTLVSKLPVMGWIQESRMVGSALYVSTQAYRQVEDGTKTYWTWSSVVSSFDLADPLVPVVKGSLTFDGYNNMVAASEQFFFVGTQASDWNSSRLQLIDISAPDGAMKLAGSINIAGTIPDKFKIHQNGEVLTVISQTWNESRRWVTLLQTYSITDPNKPNALGRLELAAGEQLYATRFDGDKVYIVTFLRIDPLWIVDLSNPSKPQIKGELHVPGWSTYLHPMGDRLLSVGIDTTNGWHVTVSLFDVADVTNPLLIDREMLGGNWSSSEANNDEKAFNVLTDAGLILLPWQSSSTNWTVTHGMQLIDFNRSSLSLRGVIPHAFAPRRATMVKDHIFSIDSNRLLSVAAPDRDRPEVKAELVLSWNVTHVIPVGGYLLQLAADDGNGSRILVTTSTQPDEIIQTLVLTTNLPIVGIQLNKDKLYIAQASQSSYGGYYGKGMLMDLEPVGDNGSNISSDLRTTIIDASKPSNLTLLGFTDNKVDSNASVNDLTAFWLKPDVLVWASQQQQYWGYYMRMSFWGGYGGNQTFFSVGVNDVKQPKALSTYVAGTNAWSGGSAVFQSGTLLYSSHHEYEVVTTQTPDPKDSVTVSYLNNIYLDVVDFTDPTLPASRPGTSIPNDLKGISKDGSILYMVGYHPQDNSVTGYHEYLDVASYDGVKAFSITSNRLSNFWPHPVTILDGQVFLGITDEKNSKSVLEKLQLNQKGDLERVSSILLPTPAQELSSIAGQILVRTSSDMTLYDPNTLQGIAYSESPGCYYWAQPVINGSVIDGFWSALGQYGVMPLEPITKP